MQLALPNAAEALKSRFHLPPAVPPFDTRTYRLFSALWIIIFLLALVGPLAGLYDRYNSPENNSQLLLGSRAGFAVSPSDATAVRFTVGPEAETAGVRAGDRIVAIYGIPLPKVMPVTEEALAQHSDDPAYIAMGNVLFGTDNSQVPLTVRDPGGRIRDVTITAGEHHIDAGARRSASRPSC
jgi:Periplasmic protease